MSTLTRSGSQLMRAVLSFSFLLLALLLFTSILNTRGVGALSGDQFQAGNIIEDAVFYNTGSMTPQEIQNFLNSKLPSCDTNGEQMYNSTQTRAQWAAANERPLPPYTCLKDYSQTIQPITNGGSDLCENSVSGGTKTAAQLIHGAAIACGINPQVLIVMLQKEQSLITDDWPWPTQYDKAMGYACPDSGPNNSANCDSEFFGFFNQVYNAAKAFRRYEANPNSYNYKAERNNTILYHPNSACGTSNVYIENQATASLYIYTPYRPNQAALNNLYGTGDSCSAYGNRNFWRMFNDWFGSTHGQVHLWELVSQYAFTDNTKTVPVDLNDVRPGQRVYVGVKARNIGNTNWGNVGNHPVLLGTTAPQDRVSSMCDSTWLSCNRPAVLKESVVAPNQIGTFEFWINIPNKTGIYTENFSLLVNNYKWMNDVGMNFQIRVSTGLAYDWQVKSIQYFKNSQKTNSVNPASIKASDVFYTRLVVRNVGINDWNNDSATPIRLAPSSPSGRISKFCHSEWLSCGRITRMNESNVRTGEDGVFEYWNRVPSKIGTYNEKFTLLEEGVSWMDSYEASLYYKVTHGIYKWSIASQNAYTDTTKTALVNVSSLAPGQRVYAEIKVKNTGGTTWIRGFNAPNLGTNAPHDRLSKFCDSTWLSCSRPSAMSESQVAPGEFATYSFWYRAPYAAGSYTEHFKLVVEGRAWLNENAMNFNTTVAQPTLTWQLRSMFAYTDSTKTTPVNLQNLTPGQRVYIGLTAKNTGNAYWYRSGFNPILLGTNAPHNRNSVFCDTSWISCARPTAMKEFLTQPNETATFEFWFKAPQQSGSYTEHFKLVAEGRTWLNENSLNFKATVN
jgi:hypothetical protein